MKFGGIKATNILLLSTSVSLTSFFLHPRYTLNCTNIFASFIPYCDILWRCPRALSCDYILYRVAQKTRPLCFTACNFRTDQISTKFRTNQRYFILNI